jgi:3-deoxy-D-manno-octulosonate 8-phosphate phosphatase (KDO 8-P phosphatase)
MDLRSRCQPLKLLISDVDGVLTDGRLIYHAGGGEAKAFHIRDGLGIKLWQQAGHRFAIITARKSPIVTARAAELGVELVRQGAERKLDAVREITRELGLEVDETCYVGDDLPDLAAIRQVGLGVAVADACDEVRRAAHHVTHAAGGAGAVREIIETILTAQQKWDDAIREYL